MMESTRQTLRKWRNALILVAIACGCSFAGGLVGWFVGMGQASREGRDAIHFSRYRQAMTEFVNAHEMADGQILRGEALSSTIRDAGIVQVSRMGRLIVFELPHKSFLADDADSAFVYQLDDKGRVVDELVSNRRTVTYHVQSLSTPGWYFWMFSD